MRGGPVWIPVAFGGCWSPAIRGLDRRFLNDLTLITPPPGLSGADYSMIEQAVMETARGRWFLLEYARRQRAAETQRLADLVDRLEAMAAQPAPAEPAAAPIAAGANAALAERLSDLAWRLREDGAHPALCAELEREIARVRPAGPGAGASGAPLAPRSDPPPLATPPWEAPREKPAAAPAHEPRVKALTRLDDLPIVEKLALFC